MATVGASARTINFSSGPAALPEPVLRKAQAALWDLAGSGIGILEHSHRGPEFAAVLDDAEQRLRALADVPASHTILFVTGTASQHFFMVPMNFLPSGATADYVHTGAWSGKAIEEARRHGGPAAVHLAGDASGGGFRAIPTALTWSAAPAYAHYTSNETIHGTQWATPPRPPAGTPLVVDASSDFLSRPLDVAAHDLIYAGAQKNLGPSGLTVVIARKTFIERAGAGLPALLRYQTYAAERSLHNTPNTFAIYVIAEVLAWIAEQGGLAGMAALSEAKATRLYAAIDGSPHLRGHAEPGSRSRMNVTFRATTPALEEALLADAEAAGLSGLRGHRSVGGLRASIYNAMPMAGVERLVEVIAAFDRKHT
jgi:phosphoserine aminotransferase